MTDENNPIIDSLLEEMLSEKHPPDLSQSVLNRLQEDNSAHFARWESAIAAASNRPLPLDQVVSTVQLESEESSAASSATLASTRIVRRKAHESNATRWLWGAVSVSAAACLLVLSSVFVQRQGKLGEEQAEKTVQEPKSSEEDTRREESVRENHTVAGARKPQQLSTDNVPFDAKVPAESRAVVDDVRPVTSAIETENIVEIIDQQFENLWKRKGIVAQSSVSSDEWLHRAYQILVGRAPKGTELNALESNGSFKARKEVVDQLVSSQEFAKLWSLRLADAWLGPKSRGDRSPSRLAFENWLGKQLAQGRALREIQQELLVAKGSDHPEAKSFAPQAHWIAASYEGNSWKLAERLGSSMLDLSTGCARCHDEKSVAKKTFWGTASLLSSVGVETYNEDGKSFRRVIPKKYTEAFYERPDGTLAAALPTYWDGVPATRSDLEATVEWFTKSKERETAAVNTVWNFVLGQRLVPQYGLDESDGALERGELQQFLAQQWKAHGEDIRDIASWIALSRPFAVGSSELSLNDYFLASESELEAWRRADRQMAFYSAPYPMAKDNSPVARVSELAQWIKRKEDGTIRAQPNARSQKSNVPADGSNQLADHVRLLVHVRGLAPKLDEQVDAWLRSNLTWEQLVEHASLLSRNQAPNAKYMELAREILAQSGGDRKSALSRLILTELGFY